MQTLETKRLILRLFKPDDLNDFHAYAKIDGVGEMAGWPAHQSVQETKNVLEAFIKNEDVYAIVLKQDNRVIGSLGVHDRKRLESKKHLFKHQTLGYVLAKDMWGQGLMTEAVKKVIDHIFTATDIDELYCGHFDFNHRSKRIIKKCGFEYLSDSPYESKLLDKTFNECQYVLRKSHYIKKDD